MDPNSRPRMEVRHRSKASAPCLGDGGGERGARGPIMQGAMLPGHAWGEPFAYGPAKQVAVDMPPTRASTHLLSTSNDLSSACQGNGSCNPFIMADDGPHTAACPQVQTCCGPHLPAPSPEPAPVAWREPCSSAPSVARRYR